MIRLGLFFLVFMACLLTVIAHMIDAPLMLVLPVILVAVVAVCLIFLHYSILPLYVLVFLSLLPTGLIPYSIFPYLFFLIHVWALGSWLLTVVLQRRTWVWTPPVLLLIAFMGWSLVTLAWAPDWVAGRRELVQYVYVFILLFLILNQVDSLPSLDRLMNIMAINGWILLLSSVITLLFTDYEFGTRFKILDTNENQLGILLVVTVPGVLWSVMRSPRQQKTLRMCLSLIFITCSFFFIALSGSRGSLGSFFILLIAFWLWKPTRPWGKFSLVLVALSLFAAPFIFSTIQNRLEDPGEDKYGSRLSLWHAATLLIRDHPIGGAGIGNGTFVMLDYVNSIGQTVGMRENYPAHNPILEVGTDTGLLGIGLYLGALGSAIWMFLNRFLYFHRIGASLYCAYCALIACMSMGFFFSWVKAGGIKNQPTYFLLLALLIISTRLRPDESDALAKTSTEVNVDHASEMSSKL